MNSLSLPSITMIIQRFLFVPVTVLEYNCGKLCEHLSDTVNKQLVCAAVPTRMKTEEAGMESVSILVEKVWSNLAAVFICPSRL